MSPSQSRSMTVALIICLGGAMAIASAAKEPSLTSTVVAYALGN